MDLALLGLLAVVYIFAMPIVIVVKISDLSQKMTQIESTLASLKQSIEYEEWERGESVSPGFAPPATETADADARRESVMLDLAEFVLPQQTMSEARIEQPVPTLFEAEGPEEIPKILQPLEETAVLAEIHTEDEEIQETQEVQEAPEVETIEEAEEVDAEEPLRLPQQFDEEAEPAAAFSPPPQPVWIELQFKRLVTWLLSEGNIWVTVGMLLFIAGFGMLFSYIAQNNLLPLEVRLAGAAVVGIALTAFGWKLRTRRQTYALILQGGGIGVLYIVLLAGAKFGEIIPIPAAVGGMLLLSVFTVILATLQNFELLAIFALLGGFAAPILVSTGSNQFVALFSIYTLLNLEILALTVMKDWRKTRWAGFLASFVVGAIWGLDNWETGFFHRVEPFLVGFFLNYSILTLIPLARGGRSFSFVKNEGGIDRPMLLTVPFAFLFLQMPAIDHIRYGVAISLLAMGVWYLLLGRLTLHSEKAKNSGLSPTLFLGYCILFSNLAIPFVFRHAISSAVWAIEGTFLIAMAAKQRRRGLLTTGILLHVASFLLYCFAPSHAPAHLLDIRLHYTGLLDWQTSDSAFLLTGLLFAASALVAGYFCRAFEDDDETVFRLGRVRFILPPPKWLLPVFPLYGTLWWTLSVFHAAYIKFSHIDAVSALSILCIGATAAYLVSIVTKWREVRLLAIPALAMLLLKQPFIVAERHWVSWGLSKILITDWLAVLAMFVAGFHSYRKENPSPIRMITWTILLFLTASYTAIAWGWWGELHLNADWGSLCAVLPAAALSCMLSRARWWRVVGLNDSYRSPSIVAATLLLLLRLPRFVPSLVQRGEGIAAIYIPLLNPLEMWQLLFLASSLFLLMAASRSKPRDLTIRYALPLAGFFWVNSIAARAAWWYFDENIFSYYSIADAPHFQALITILWGVTALLLIFGAKKIGNRVPWFMGAGLLALDILKLLTIDLENVATIIRIFAFLLLGGLFSLIGWIAPLPPKKVAADAANEETLPESEDIE